MGYVGGSYDKWLGNFVNRNRVVGREILDEEFYSGGVCFKCPSPAAGLSSHYEKWFKAESERWSVKWWLTNDGWIPNLIQTIPCPEYPDSHWPVPTDAARAGYYVENKRYKTLASALDACRKHGPSRYIYCAGSKYKIKFERILTKVKNMFFRKRKELLDKLGYQTDRINYLSERVMTLEGEKDSISKSLVVLQLRMDNEALKTARNTILLEHVQPSCARNPLYGVDDLKDQGYEFVGNYGSSGQQLWIPPKKTKPVKSKNKSKKKR